jgi:hypothetical protein
MVNEYTGMFPNKVTSKFSGQVYRIIEVEGKQAFYSSKNKEVMVTISDDNSSICIMSKKSYRFYDLDKVLSEYKGMSSFLSFAIDNKGSSYSSIILWVIASLIIIFFIFGPWAVMWAGIALMVFSVFKMMVG